MLFANSVNKQFLLYFLYILFFAYGYLYNQPEFLVLFFSFKYSRLKLNKSIQNLILFNKLNEIIIILFKFNSAKNIAFNNSNL